MSTRYVQSFHFVVWENDWKDVRTTEAFKTWEELCRVHPLLARRHLRELEEGLSRAASSVFAPKDY